MEDCQLQPAMEQTVQDALERKREELRQATFRKRCKSIGKFFLTTGLLLAVNAMILVAGGFLFEHLEKLNEQANCVTQYNNFQESLQQTTELVYAKAELIRGEDRGSREKHRELLDTYRKFLKDFANATVTINYKGFNCTELGDNQTWSFTNSVVYSLTIITTIGYGHIYPVTPYGKILTIVFAVVGIPVYLLALATIGDTMAVLFKKFYWVVCCCGCCKQEEKPIDCYDVVEKEVMLRRANTKFGDLVGDNEGEADDDEEDEKGECKDELEDVTIPLTFTIALLLGCVLAGAVVFLGWDEENNWNFTNSFYYSFVTISTIGFGDLVPQIRFRSIVGVVLYITLGMAAVSMCFQLMADEVLAKFEWFASKCGLEKHRHSNSNDADDEAGDRAPSRPASARPPTMMRQRTILSRGGTRTNIIVKRQSSKLSASPAPTNRGPSREGQNPSSSPGTSFRHRANSKTRETEF